MHFVMINNSSRTGQAFWLGIGSLVSFSFGIVSAAILSRFLSVEEYGTYRQVLYVYSTLLTIFTLGMPRAYSFFLARIPIEQGRKSIDKINRVFLLLGSVFSLVLFCGADLIGIILKNPNLPSALRCFALTPVFLLPVLGVESIMATYKKTRFATIYIILTRVFNLICIVLPVVLIRPTANVAVMGFTVSSALCCLAGLLVERKPFRGVATENSNLSIKDVLKYSLPLLIASLWGIVINSSPQFFISRWYGTPAFAEFANGFIELPFAGMVIGAVSTVLLPEISRLSKDDTNLDKVIRIWRSAFEKSAKIIYPLSVFACVFAYQIIDFLYGNKYFGAIFYFQLIVVINLIRVVPYAPIMMGLDMGKKYAIASMIPALALVLIDFVWVQIFNSPYGIAVMQCLAIILQVYIIFSYISRRLKIKIHDIIPAVFCAKIIVISILSSVLTFYLNRWFLIEYSNIIQLVISMTFFLIVYFTISQLLGISYKELFKSVRV